MNTIRRTGSAAVLVLMISTMLLTSCVGRKKEPEEVITLYNDPVIIEHYMEAVEDWDHAIYEEVYFDWGERSIGPTEYRYRGVVYLTDVEAERLWNSYEWVETDAPDFEFGKVDGDSLGAGPWYKCSGFDSDNYSTVVPSYTVFDGEKIVFDFHQI